MYAVKILPSGQTSWRAIADASDLLTGETYSENPPEASLADYVAGATAAIQAWLESIAKENGYDSLASCISYLGSVVAQYKADAIAASTWRDSVWPAAYQMLTSQSANPPDPLPSYDQLIAQLPQPSAFGWIVHPAGDPTPAA